MKYILIILLFSFVLIQCSVKTPEITLTGEKTALENQVLGNYEQVESDTWITASSRAGETQQDTLQSARQQNVLDATRTRKFNQDEITEFKKEHVIGENNQGFLDILGGERYDNDPQYREMVDQIVEQENQARRIIYQRLMTVNTRAKHARKNEVKSIFARMRQQESQPGTMIQKADGTWVEKEK